MGKVKGKTEEKEEVVRMPKKMTVFEKINPLARLRRRREEKSEREFRIVKLGRICPVCAVPLEVSSEEVGGNVVVTTLKCPKCRRGWGYAEPIQGTGGRSSGEVDVGRVAELGYRVLNFFEKNSKPHEAALVARLLADMLEGVYGAPVDPETYGVIARGFKIAAAKRYGLKYREESGEPGVMYG
jgi:hypothetical protein